MRAPGYELPGAQCRLCRRRNSGSSSCRGGQCVAFCTGITRCGWYPLPCETPYTAARCAIVDTFLNINSKSPVSSYNTI